jgi:hypothetical protein
MRRLPLLLLLAFVPARAVAADVGADTVPSLRAALADARAGTTIRIAPGTYEGGLFAEDLRGIEPLVEDGVAGRGPARAHGVRKE